MFTLMEQEILDYFCKIIGYGKGDGTLAPGLLFYVVEILIVFWRSVFISISFKFLNTGWHIIHFTILN